MSERIRTAERCLVATCAHLALTNERDTNFQVWRDCLSIVLVDAQKGSRALFPLVEVAEEIVSASTALAISGAMQRLRFAVSGYYARAAAQSFEKFQEQPNGACQ
ncbi:hypothetical protein [Planktotalea sp.]|uniref:hypothetical protein n=1 Tax=Planktotalea sp. TaxID=2029877 RepID=UPI003D6B1F7E